MLFAFHLVDRPNAGELRLRVRPEHKDYLAQAADRIAFAGLSHKHPLRFTLRLAASEARGKRRCGWTSPQFSP